MVQSRLVSALLVPALKLLLRSQVETIDALTVDIQGSDRQILSGHIPGVALSAQRAIYQGLHLSALEMTAATIRINIGQVVRGKPLKLLAPIPVDTTVFLNADGLEQSTSAPLLQDALTDLWQKLCQAAPDLVLSADVQADEHIDDTLPPTRSLHCGEEYLEIQIQSEATAPPLRLRTGLTIVDGHILQFTHPYLLKSDAAVPQPIESLNGFCLDLGRDVTLETLNISPDGIRCIGIIMVMP